MPASLWIWDYFTLESIYNSKCRLCDNCVKPKILNTMKALLLDHIRSATDSNHRTAKRRLEGVSRNTVNWDLYYKTLHSTDNILNPKAECECCGHIISSEDCARIRKETFLYASPEMKLHLKQEHKVDENNRIVLNNLLQDSQAYYNMTKIGQFKVYTCKECVNDDECRPKNAIMFVKHMIDKHCEVFKKKFSRDQVPKELHPLYDSAVKEDITLSSDTADRPGSSRQGSSGGQWVSSESTQSSRKRKEEVLKPWQVSTQIKEPPYKRRKSSSTEDSD